MADVRIGKAKFYYLAFRNFVRKVKFKAHWGHWEFSRCAQQGLDQDHELEYLEISVLKPRQNENRFVKPYPLPFYALPPMER